jgi:hypothetical protein
VLAGSGFYEAEPTLFPPIIPLNLLPISSFEVSEFSCPIGPRAAVFVEQAMLYIQAEFVIMTARTHGETERPETAQPKRASGAEATLNFAAVGCLVAGMVGIIKPSKCNVQPTLLCASVPWPPAPSSALYFRNEGKSSVGLLHFSPFISRGGTRAQTRLPHPVTFPREDFLKHGLILRQQTISNL